ncbi:acyl-CoA dehydrogenase family protein [Streptomyces sp. H10-C2]|uniref:acyl-CoA dehydrogenase family protein n=1 Tax=unclassified Streptomyces TaxID=2593676 RepID=UPI0024BB4A2F|nr:MULTISPECIES: acyl-CoA dehydrogenase family protein [unclassified Streptomyces]MDJ0346347.1 acyl-CoA dehydrogenase family protein [Streptomyces sp. PH10-H1]MDJ0370784.1 acyl-CoA dehydrogenase family protein [Streptomyces sp. H10-C2]
MTQPPLQPQAQPGTPDLLYSDVEDDLRSAVRGLLADHCPPTAVLARIESDTPYDLDLWRTLAAEVGLAGLLVPEELGGHGGSAREAAVVLEELGATVAPVPFLGSAVLATSALLAVPGTAGPLLKRLASGEATAALAVPLPTAPGADFPHGVRADADGVLSGRVTSVADASAADVLVVPAAGPGGPGLYEIAADAPGVRITVPVALDLTRPIADVTFDAAAARLLAGPDTATAALHRALLTGAGLLASEQLGIAQWCLDETVRYLNERHQFGRPVGSFQSLKHRLADIWLEVVSARAAARNAADALASGSPDAAVAVAVAQAHCATTAVHAAEECIQLHGGIGMTWEHPAHLYLKRAKADEIALGTPGHHRAALAELVDLPAVSG